MRLVFILDSADPDRLADFWAAALGYDREPIREPYVVLKLRAGEPGPELILQRVPEPKAGKNRMHLDMRIDDLVPEVERLQTLGVRVLGGEIEEDGFRWLGRLAFRLSWARRAIRVHVRRGVQPERP